MSMFSDHEIAETIEIDPFTRALIVYDSDPINPRTDYDHAGTMVCWHHRYTLGDEQPRDDPHKYLIKLAGDAIGHDRVDAHIDRLDLLAACRPGSIEYAWDWFDNQVRDYVHRILESHYIMLPLYLYDHSGITMNCGGFSCPWDSGQVGFIYISKADAVKEWGKKICTKAVRDSAIKCLKAEVAEYARYLEGQVYGYVIESRDPDSDPDESDSWDYAGESCWGFIGYTDESGIMDEARHAGECIAAEQAEQRKADAEAAAHKWARTVESSRPDMYGGAA